MSSFSPATETALATARGDDGTHLWIVQGDASGARPLVTLNLYLRNKAFGTTQHFEYKSLDGEDLHGWLLLPPGFQPGTRYPLVTWVYGGLVFGSRPPGWTRLNDPNPYNLHLLAAKGYVVLLPSMPLKPEGMASDPYSDMPKGVLPAVDKVVEMGIADPKRLAVMGQSYGGYSTYALITQSNRFSTAVALAGFCDLVSLYGTFDARFRYDEYAREWMAQMLLTEVGQQRMQNPPWKDFARYARNSPITYVDRIQTPVMIVQGDMDYVPLEQGEQFFSSLYRQGKRASFVRYWGEGHGIESPANIRDLWQRIFIWLEESPASSL